nr:NADH deshydrogenase subunit 2 [Xorides funiuensis]
MNQNSFLWIYIYPMMFMSPILLMSMNSWFSMWMIMEMNMMTFIPLIMNLNKFYKEMTMKYFIIQSFSSSMLMFSLIFFFNESLNMNNKFLLLMNIISMLSLLIKIGSVPFHYWYINLMNNMNWVSCLMLSSWQKIIPLMMLMNLMNFKMIMFFSLINCLISAIFGLNHQSIRLIFCYSSMNHLSWILLNLLINELLLLLYFLSYFIINMSIMLILNKFNLYYINQLYMFNNKYFKIFMIMNLISISGLPPMFGFLMKWYSMYMMIMNNMMFMIFILLMMSILTFIFYSKLMISIMLKSSINNKIFIMMKFISKISLKLKLNLIFLFFMNLWFMSMWLF